jgi:hypothetical protein
MSAANQHPLKASFGKSSRCFPSETSHVLCIFCTSCPSGERSVELGTAAQEARGTGSWRAESARAAHPPWQKGDAESGECWQASCGDAASDRPTQSSALPTPPRHFQTFLERSAGALTEDNRGNSLPGGMPQVSGGRASRSQTRWLAC